MRKILSLAGALLCLALVFLAVLSACSVRWGFSMYAGLNMEEIVYELRAPLEGTESGLLRSYGRQCLLPAAGAAVLAGGVMLWRHHRRRSSRIFRLLLGGAAIAAIAASGAVFAEKVDFVTYWQNRNTVSDYIETNYVDPASVEISFPGKKRNLIWLYLESVETTFADKASGGAMETNIIPNLTALAGKYEDFSGSDSALAGGVSFEPRP